MKRPVGQFLILEQCVGVGVSTFTVEGREVCVEVAEIGRVELRFDSEERKIISLAGI